MYTRIMMFLYCPGCGSKNIQFHENKKIFCPECSFTYFHNAATAVAGIILVNEEFLFLKRAREPGKGKIDVPGGFVDPGESAEQALARELFEELEIKAISMEYFMSFPNTYLYNGISYSTCDLFYKVTIPSLPRMWDRTEIEDILLIPREKIHTLEFAFISIEHAINAYNNG